VGKGSSSPDSPDYNQLIPLQEQANINQQQLQLQGGRVNTVTPYGSTTWTQGSPNSSGGSASPTGGAYDQYGQYVPYNPNQPQNNQVAGQTGSTPQQGPGGGGANSANAVRPTTGVPNNSGETPAQNSFFSNVNAPYNQAAQDNTWTETQTLSPGQQAILNQQQGLQQGELGTANQLLANQGANIANTPNLTGMMSSYGLGPGSAPQYQGGTVSANQVAQGTYGSEMGLLEPSMQSQAQGLDQSLKAEGFDPMTTQGGAMTAENNLNNQQNLVRTQAADSALANANTYATGELGREETALQGNEGLFSLGSQTAQTQYGLPLNALSSLSTGAQVQTPGLSGQPGAPGVAGTNILGTEQTGYGNQVGQYNASQAASQNTENGLFSLGTAGILSYL
jgi:hypothetical protein